MIANNIIVFDAEGDIIIAVFTDITPKGFKCIKATNRGNKIIGLPNTGAYIQRGFKRMPVINGMTIKSTPSVKMVLIITT